MTKAGPFTRMVVFDIGEELWFPQSVNLREDILKEFHCSRFAMHLGDTKMYDDLRR